MKKDTKQKIIETGAEIIHLKGFHHTGIQEILKAAGVPKGSFYNYFNSKEDFGLQVIDYFEEFFASLSNEILEDTTISPLSRIKRLLKAFMAFFESKDFTYGCPIGNLSQEMGDLSPSFQVRLKQAMDALVDIYDGMIFEAQKQGEISKHLDSREAASFLVSSWQGALIRMKIEINAKSLENHYKMIFKYFLKP
ncbi:MAG: TetR family transcriptional regulator C-terminal domain-containing protein [Thermodesulfobacteriota bacterium]|nr:TetR family transcriptional regulator C-terminal domain-containing protein [Thermodesulfobacteriota bacterium]